MEQPKSNAGKEILVNLAIVAGTIALLELYSALRNPISKFRMELEEKVGAVKEAASRVKVRREMQSDLRNIVRNP